MRALLSLLARAGFALSLAALTLAVLRLGPVYAEPPLDVRALPVTPWLLGFAIVAALMARREPEPGSARPLAQALALVAVVLGAVVMARGPVGVEAEIRGAAGQRNLLAPGPIDVTPTDLAVARGTVVWEGPLRAPQSGKYRVWVKGRGKVELRLDDKIVLAAEAEDLDAGAVLPIGRGEHRLSLRYERTGQPEMRVARIRGHRLRLGWIRPRASGELGEASDWIAPRYLGARAPAATWVAIDVLSVALAGLLGACAFCMRWERPAPAPGPHALRHGEWAASLAGYVAVLGLMSWPLVADLAGHGIVDRGDGQLSVWLVAWDAHALVTSPSRLFEAPIFHPAKQALAFSENLLLPALLAAPATLIGGPVLGYNLVFLLGALASGLGVQLLVRRACGDAFAGFVAGVLYAAGAHRWARIVHLHEHFTVFLPLALLALDRFWERRTLRRALLLGLVLALQAMASIYLGVITVTLVGVLVLVGLVAGLRAKDLPRLAAGLALTGLLVAPLLLPYLRMRERYGAEWSLAAVEPHALTLPSYLASGTRLYAGLTERHQDPELRRRPLFPGLVPLALGIAGLSCAPRRYRVAALIGSCAAVVLSLGPETFAYRFLYENVVFFRGIRGVFRFAVVPVLMLCVLAGFALAGRRRLACAALLFGLVEATAGPLRLGAYEGPSATARWLAGKAGAAVFLPMGELEDARVMLDEIPHFRPLLNGYSSFTPAHYRWLPDLLETPLSEEALRLLRALDVRHVVAREELALPIRARLGADRIYAVPEGQGARATPCPRLGAPTLWSGRGMLLDLGAERRVSRIVFELSDSVPEREPQLSVSSDGTRFRSVSARLLSAAAVLALAENPQKACAEILLETEARARFVSVSGVPARPGGRMAAE